MNKWILLAAVSLVFGCGGKKKRVDTPAPTPPAKQQAASPSEVKAEEVAAPVPTALKPAGTHWAYKGEHGASHWGTIDAKFATCESGKAQSPVNLKWTKPTTGGKLYFSYGPSKSTILDNGHSIQVAFEAGNKISIRGADYELIQLHFHSSSEHKLSGTQLPIEIHFVHKSNTGKYAVIGVFAIEGEANSTIEYLWKYLPKQKYSKVNLDDALVNPLALIPPKLTYYNYSGSLTTPPCTEGVDWNVLNTPITMSRDQILRFRKLYDNNNRPLQPLNKRKVTNY